jgi:hypothetical protein
LDRKNTSKDEVVERIYSRFRTTTENDATITAKLGAEGLSVSARQVKDYDYSAGGANALKMMSNWSSNGRRRLKWYNKS